MDYISVKDASEKFDISARRVQKLCESNRIDGCTMISGVWLIPAEASKPADERTADIPDNNEYLTLKELCSELSISTATGRNWIKLGKLKAEFTEKKTPYFTKSYIDNLKSEIQSGNNNALKSRRNKKFVSGNSLYNSYVSEQCKNIQVLQELLNIIENEQIELSTNVIHTIVADCSLHLLSQKLQLEFASEKQLILKFLQKDISVGEYDLLISSLIDDIDFSINFCKNHPHIFELEYIFEPNEDILGLIYISCNNIGSRKATGLYYTPTSVVKKLISKLEIADHDKILDPCCGTGNFLLQLPPETSFEMIYGNDIDKSSVKITRLNMALKFPKILIAQICEHITDLDYLTKYSKVDFQFIIGNPPWGYDFSDEEKITFKKLYRATSGKTIESYDIFIERSLNSLSINGKLSFVLPEAVLNVKSHTNIREIILQKNSIKYLEFLGNVFDGVQCPCIILQLTHNNCPMSTIGMTVCNSIKSFNIDIERTVTSEYFSFSTSDQEYEILKKIKNCNNSTYLANNADFALGIVTGNNKDYISQEKTDENEMILKGADISKYHINPTKNYIIFKPDSFQQIAPTEMYRAPEKLLYRFISNQLVFAYDAKQKLSLNSCNIVIPKLKDAKIKYILAILNSRVAQFIYKKDFNSVKVLKSHIESIPIPIVDDQIQDKIINITNILISGSNADNINVIYDQLDQLIFDVFNLSSDEQQIIKSAVDGKNKFLS